MEWIAQSLDVIWTRMVAWPVLLGLCVFPLLGLGFMVLTRGTRFGWFADPFFNNPAKTIWSVSHNIGLIAFNGLLWIGLAYGLSIPAKAMASTIQLDLMSTLPFWLQFGLAMLIFDFVRYWNHRLLHSEWMWGVHMLHHSDEHMNFSTTYRIHIFQALHMSIVSLLMMGWLKIPVEAAALTLVVRNWYGMYVHSGLPFDHGIFKKLLCSPDYHRWHHADDPSVYGTNYCDIFPVWDILFGTYRYPGRCTLPMGVAGAPQGLVAVQIFPFRYWRDLIRAKRDARRAAQVDTIEAAE